MINFSIFSDANQRLRHRLISEDIFSNALGADPKFERLFSEISRVEEKIGTDLFVLFEEDSRYPTTLSTLPSKDRPRVFIAAGNVDLLGRPSVGICGSRKASEKGLAVTYDLCGALAEKGVVVVSGYAAGVDEAAHRAALTSGGSTICVLAEGIFHFRVRQTLRENWDWQRTLVLSQFGFDPIWQAGRAMQRNKTIVGMSGATVVVEARDKGGTLDAGQAALRLSRPSLSLNILDRAKRRRATEFSLPKEQRL